MRFSSLLLVYVILCVACICKDCKWKNLDLSKLSGTVIKCSFSVFLPPNTYDISYSVCAESVSCGGGINKMIIQKSIVQPDQCYYLAEVDGSVEPEQMTFPDGTSGYRLIYANGESDNNCLGNYYIIYFFMNGMWWI